eukprot:scpid71993/ scgid6629/ 
MDDQGSGSKALERIVVYVWLETLLPMLSIQDVFHFCAVNKTMRRLLFNESTFKRLCQQRYKLSPHLDVSYIRVAKSLHIAHQVASVCDSLDHSTLRINNNYDDDMSEYKFTSVVRLFSLALKPYDSAGLDSSCLHSGLLHPLIKKISLYPEEGDVDLPDLSRIMIRSRCTPINPGRSPSWRKYRIEDITRLLYDICGSVERFQEAIISYVESNMSELEACLPYVNRSRRLVALAKGLHILAKRDTRIYSVLGLVGSFSLADHIAEWTYNPYIVSISLLDLDLDTNSAPLKQVLLTHRWIKTVAKLASNHSVLTLLIIGRLCTSHVDDYFSAIKEYEEAVRRNLPQSGCPSRHDLYHGLGNFLLSSPQEYQNQKEWTKVELVDAMVKYGNELTGKDPADN